MSSRVEHFILILRKSAELSVGADSVWVWIMNRSTDLWFGYVVYIYRYIEMFLQLQVPLCPKGFFLFMSQLQSSKQMWNEQLKYLLHKIFCSKLCPSLMASFSFIELCVSVSLKIKVKVSLCCCKQNFIITISTRILFSTIHNQRCDVNFHNNSPVMYDKCVFLILIFS